MNKRIIRLILVTFVTGTLFCFVASAAFGADTIHWKGTACFGVSTPLGKYTIGYWKKFMDEMSGGRIKLTLHDANEIVPATKVYDAVRDGLLDFGANTPAFQKGTYPAGDLFYTLPGGVLEFHDLILWLYGGGGKELEQEMYGDEIVVFPLGLTPPEELWSKKQIKTLDDIKGLKIRSAGLCMELWQKLGASVVLLAGGEVLPALQRGLIDAAEYVDAAYDYNAGFHEVCKYRLGPPIHMSNNIFQLVINPKSWKALPDDLKATVETAAMAATFQGYADYWQETIKANQKIEEYGTITTKLSKADQQRARELTMEIIDEKSKNDPFFKKVWESQKSFLESYRPYHDLTKFD